MRRLAFTLIAIVLFAPPIVAMADGFVVFPEPYVIHETEQKAVVHFENGVETLILSVTFRGNAKDFGWLVPSPGRPQVSRGSDSLFTALQEIVGQRATPGPVPLGLGGSDRTVGEGVTVLETKSVEYYDVTVLQADDKDALTDWLKEKGYVFPTAASYLLNDYIENGWFFTAFRINPESLDFKDVSTQLREGHAVPVKIVFPTERPVYPLKLSQVVHEEVVTPSAAEPATNVRAQTPAVIPAYVTGKYGQAAEYGTIESSSYILDPTFPTNDGAVDLWVNLPVVWSGCGYRTLWSVFTPSTGKDALLFRLAKDCSTRREYIQYVGYTESGFRLWQAEAALTPNVWHHIATSWSSASPPAILVDGVPQTVSPGYGETSWLASQTSAFFSVAGRKGATDFLNGSVDEVRIWNRRLTPDELASLAGNAETSPLSALANSVLFRGSFDGNTSLLSAAGQAVTAINISDYRQSAPVTPKRLVPPSTVGVSLYVLADSRQELSNFSTTYANWIAKDPLEKLAADSTGKPLLTTGEKKMFLTVLTRSMRPSEMTDDLFLARASDQSTIGTEVAEPQSTPVFYLVVGIGIALSILVVIALLLVSRSQSPPSPPGPVSPLSGRS